jgi:RimJ/RimL family protein N-acetyltransferase
MLPLETDRLILRPSTRDELDTIYHMLVQEIEGESFTRDDFDTELQFDLYLAQQPLGQRFGRPSIYLKADNRYIGYSLLMPRLCTPEERALYTRLPTHPVRVNALEAELGWAISDRYRNQGYATEAAHALIAYGFHELRLPRIIAFTDQSNAASMRVMQKLGMRVGQHVETGVIAGLIENAAAQLHS